MVGTERFQETEAVLRALIESPQRIVIFALDRQYRYLAYNQNHARTMQQIWGVQIGVGLDMLELIGRDDDRSKARVNFDRALAGENFTVVEEYGDTRMERRVYEDIYSPVWSASGEIVGLAVYLRDITEQRRAELELERYRSHLEEMVEQRTDELKAAHAQLLYAQKLESLGVLAGGVAHDFNNLLAVILARTELYFRDAPDSQAGQTHVSIIRDTAFEARMLTKQLLGYAGKGRFTVEPLDLGDVVQNMAQLLRASISKDIRLDFHTCAAPVVVQGDSTQLRQVLLNLVTNAAEAIGSAVGEISVRVDVDEVSAATFQGACFAGEVLRGRHAYLEVQDSGSGIAPLDCAKVFDPFFTTKFAGRGLGLAAVLGIVKGHHGAVLIESCPGHGSRFRVFLPLVDAEVVRSPAPSEKPARQQLDTGCVLVVDDEPAVRAVTVAILESSGYKVLEADGGAAASQLFLKRATEIDVVLLDLAMPDMNGEQTLRELKRIRPDIAIVLLTGYAEDDVRLRPVQAELAGVVAKPFSYDELLGAVRSASIKTNKQNRP